MSISNLAFLSLILFASSWISISDKSFSFIIEINCFTLSIMLITVSFVEFSF